MCDYCNRRSRYLLNKGLDNFSLKDPKLRAWIAPIIPKEGDPEPWVLYVEAVGNDTITADEIAIKFCPMCGRRLNEVDVCEP